PERPHDDHDDDDEHFEDEGRRSIFSALWFRAILVVIVLGVVAAVAVPYVLELANQPAPKPTVLGKPEMTPSPAPVAPPAPPVASGPAGGYFVQVGAFKNPETAKKLAVRLREQKYNVEESSASGGGKPARATAPSTPPATGSASDRYDVYVSGSAPADINAKLSGKGLSAEPSGGGVVVKPSLPLRDAVALSKDLAVD